MRYIKKIQKQDVDKSIFVSKEAFDMFFIEKPLEKSKTPIIFSYNNMLITAELQNEGGSDFRIINFKNKNTGKRNRPSYMIGDIVVLTKKTNFIYFK